MPTFLDFEKPIAELEGKIEELRHLHNAGDVNIAEPNALIGFAGPRVVKETIGKDLPDGFQTSEFVLEHGYLDFIVERKNMKNKIGDYLRLVGNQPAE